MNSCQYFNDCAPTVWNWVNRSPLLTGLVNVLLMIALAIVVFVLVRQIVVRRRPLCADCLVNGDRTHTKYVYGDKSVCGDHYVRREMASESVYECPKHHVTLNKLRREGVTIDACPSGCVFLDDGELEDLEEAAESSGRSSGTMLGLAIGIAT